ncbi:MAG: transglutaminase domain-containing protein [Gemmataceae bacterium]|nr:transglutaminase domain-containing protein [Gemmataceae bacterium]
MMNRCVHSRCAKLAWMVLAGALVVPNLAAQEQKPTAKDRQFLFTYAGTVKDLKPGQVADVWLPVAVDGPEQKVTIKTKKVPGGGKIHTEKQYGNTMLHFQAKANKKGFVSFEIVYEVHRKEVKTDFAGNLTVKPTPQEDFTRFLEPDNKGPITGKPLELLKGKKLPSDQFGAAKVLYDVVNTHMKYSKEGKGWGQGDSVWACDSKFGNCSDFHALFISMARGNKIPSKFEMGFPIPAKRGEGVVGGYHCWAWFYPNQKGWVPVDISEANRNPELKDYYFGNLTEDRVRFTTGRDVNLEPRQKGPALNFFIYPYVEVDGQTHPQEKIDRKFAYQDVK